MSAREYFKKLFSYDIVLVIVTLVLALGIKEMAPADDNIKYVWWITMGILALIILKQEDHLSWGSAVFIMTATWSMRGLELNFGLMVTIGLMIGFLMIIQTMENTKKYPILAQVVAGLVFGWMLAGSSHLILDSVNSSNTGQQLERGFNMQ